MPAVITIAVLMLLASISMMRNKPVETTEEKNKR